MIRNFTQQDLDILQAYQDKGQSSRYWNYLVNMGERYAELAPGVIFEKDDELAPLHHFYWTQYRKKNSSKPRKTERREFGYELMKADLAQRTVLLQAGERLAALHLSASHIYLQHKRVMGELYSWTPLEILEPFFDNDNPNISIAQKIWDVFIDMTDIYSREASRSETLNAVALFKAHLFWMAKQDPRALNRKVINWINENILPVMMAVAIDFELEPEVELDPNPEDISPDPNEAPPDDDDRV